MCDWTRVALRPLALAHAHARPHLPLLATLLRNGLPTLLTYLAPAPPACRTGAAGATQRCYCHGIAQSQVGLPSCSCCTSHSRPLPVAQVLLALLSIAIVMASRNAKTMPPCAQAHLSAAAPCTRPPPVAQVLLALPSIAIVMTLRNLCSGSPATKPISQLLYPTSIPRLLHRCCWRCPVLPSSWRLATRSRRCRTTWATTPACRCVGKSVIDAMARHWEC